MSMLSKLKQFKDLRQQGKELQSKLSGETVTATGAGGSIKMTMDGNMAISDVTIDPSLLSPDKKSRLESGIKEAHSDALKKIQRVIATKMQESGMKLPGMS